MSKRILTYICPFCNNSSKRYNREQLLRHVSGKHSNDLPEDFSPLRYVFNYVNKKPLSYHGICTECKGPTEWDENKGRYNRQCKNPKCKASFIKKFEENNLRVNGVKRISSTAEGLQKMLAARKISGKYKFQNGVEKTYTGSYEKAALEFMDRIMNIDPNDIMAPGPVMKYSYGGKMRYYIPDFYYQPYDLIIEVKDGGDNPNKKNMAETRAKQIAKEKFIINNTTYNYLRLTNNNFAQLLDIFMTLKMQMKDETNERIIKVNENMNGLLTGYIPGFKDGGVYVLDINKSNGFSNTLEDLAITDSILCENIIARNAEGILSIAPEGYIESCGDYKIYMIDGITMSELMEKITPNLGTFVEEGFIYETIFGKKMYSYDQIGLEEAAIQMPRFDQIMDVHGSMVSSFLKGESVNESTIGIYDTSVTESNKIISTILDNWRKLVSE